MKYLNFFSLIFFLSTGLSNECVYSEWGPNDEAGNANLISNESVIEALKSVETGKSYSLGLIVDSNTPAYPPRSLELTVVQPFQQFGAGVDLYPNFAANDDIFSGWLGIGSQIDGLGHIGSADGVFYNCNRGKDFAQITGLTKLGIEKIPPLVARGVLIDIASYLNKEFIPAGETFNLLQLKGAMNSKGITIQKGDVVIFHTGWTAAKFKSAPKEWGSGAPGILPEIAEYLKEKQVIAVGADTWSLDVVPVLDEKEPFPAHPILLTNGIYILEAMNTGEMAEDGVTDFLFILGPAKVRGAVQMIVNPIAIN